MVIGLKRYQDEGDLHFVTFSCFRRLGYLRMPVARDLFEDGLDRVRRRYEFEVVGYVVMPEHVHLLASEPCVASLDVGLQALKLSVSRRSKRGQFWQARYYDFNVYSRNKRLEKLDYMHWNPVKRGLVERMEAYSVPFCYFRLVGRLKLAGWVYNFCYITAE